MQARCGGAGCGAGTAGVGCFAGRGGVGPGGCVSVSPLGAGHRAARAGCETDSAGRAAEAQAGLVYQVAPARDLSGLETFVSVEPRAATIGEDGKLSGVARFDFEFERERPSPNVEVTDDDRLLWFRLTGLGDPNRDRPRSWLGSTLEDTAMFQALVATGRCYYGPFGVRLRPGSGRAGGHSLGDRPRWLSDPEGVRRGQSRRAPGSAATRAAALRRARWDDRAARAPRA